MRGKKRKEEEFKIWEPKKQWGGSLVWRGVWHLRMSFVALQLGLSSTLEDLSEHTQAEAVTCSVGWSGRRMIGWFRK